MQATSNLPINLSSTSPKNKSQTSRSAFNILNNFHIPNEKKDFVTFKTPLNQNLSQQKSKNANDGHPLQHYTV